MRKLSALALLPLLLASPTIVHAQSEPAACSALANDAERLRCYDGFFRQGSVSSDGLSIQLQSQQLVPARPSGRAPATVTVACEAGELTVAFSFAGNLLSALGNDTGITLQYDLQAARSRTLPVNETNTALVIDNTVDSLSFLRGLVGATNLTVRVTPANSRSLSVRFRVDEFTSDVEPVIAACGN